MRTPSSAPRVPTSGVTFDTGAPEVGSTVVVTPRASLEWKPSPKLAKNSVFAQGPTIADSFGDAWPAPSRPLFAGLSLLTSKR